MAVRCYVEPSGPNAGQHWCTDDAGNFWRRRDSDPPVSNAGPSQQPGSGTTTPNPGSASATPTVAPASATATGGIDAAALQWALNAQIAAQAAKTNADRLNLLDIPKWQKDAAIAEADLKLRQAQEARAALNDEQRRQLDAQAAAINAARVSGYMPQAGPRVGDLVAQGWNKAVAEGRANPQTAAAIWHQAVGADANQAAQLAEWGKQYSITFGHPPDNDEIDAKVRSLGLNPQAPTLEREQYGTNTALEYQRILASKAGRPEDAFTYAGMIRDTPDSIRNIVNTAAARVNLPGLRVPTLGQPAQADPAAAMPLANQINPQDYQRANPYLQKMVWAGYGAQGADPDAERAKYLSSLPQWGGPRRGRVAA